MIICTNPQCQTTTGCVCQRQTMADILAVQAKVPRLRPAPADMMDHAAHEAAKDWGTHPTIADVAAANYRTKDAERRAEQAERERDEAVKALTECRDALAMMTEPGSITGTTITHAYAAAVAAHRTAAAIVKRGEDKT